MAHLLRPLIQWPRWYHRCASFSHLVSVGSVRRRSASGSPFFAFLQTPIREFHIRSRALKLRGAPSHDAVDESDDESSSGSGAGRRNRNESKRMARRAVRWGMALAEFSPPQIKRILRAAALDEDVFDAVMVVKRLGRDVREGKRRQFNYIGRLLREVEPELMDGLIRATKDGDHSMFRELPVLETLVVDDIEDEEEEIQETDEIEDSTATVVDRWCDGLIDKDVRITKEIYALQGVEFDRQKLRQLVRNVQSSPQHGGAHPEKTGNNDATRTNARRSLSNFLQGIVKQLPTL